MNHISYIVIFFASIFAHDFHMSKTQIHYKTEQKALQYTVNLFIDDLSLAVEEEFEIDSLNLFLNNEQPIADSLIHLYINKHLEVKLDGEVITPIFIGKELNSEDYEGFRCYLEVEDVESIQKFEIKNLLLTELFNDQRNILSVMVDQKSKAHHLLDKEDFIKQISL